MLVAVCSLKGSPGVTTLAIALAARWPGGARRVLVECDPSGGDVAARFSLAASPGLVSLAAAMRRGSDPALLWRHTQRLPGGLAVISAHPGADQTHVALTALVSDTAPGEESVIVQAARDPGVVVIADCGRADSTSPALPLIRAAEVMLLVSRTHADDLAHLVTRLETVGRWSARPALVLTGDGYGTADITRELGVPALARIPEDRRGAAVLCGRPGGRRGPARSPLGRAAAGLAVALAKPTGVFGAPRHPGLPTSRGSAVALVRPPVPRQQAEEGLAMRNGTRS